MYTQPLTHVRCRLQLDRGTRCMSDGLHKCTFVYINAASLNALLQERIQRSVMGGGAELWSTFFTKPNKIVHTENTKKTEQILHNLPKIHDFLECRQTQGKNHAFFARLLQNATGFPSLRRRRKKVLLFLA